MASKVRKIKLSDIEKSNKIYDHKIKVTLDDNFYINIFPNFSPIKLSELIKETILTDAQRAKDEGIDFDKITLGDWGLFNIIYKFSDLDIPDDIKSKIQAFETIMNSKYWTNIIAAFPEESILQAKQSLDNFTENYKALSQQEIERILENQLIEQES